MMKRLPPKLKRVGIVALMGVMMLSAVPYLAGPGLNTPEPLGKYLNNAFPAVVTQASGVPYEPVFPNLTFDSPLTFNELPTDDKIVIGQRNGKIYWFDKDPDVAQKNMLLDLSAKVGVVWDGGFLGLTFHPEFGTAGNNYFYVYYTTKDRNGNDFPNRYTRQSCNSEEYWGNFLILARYEMNPNTMAVSPTSEQVMLKLRMYGTTHRGGGLLFGDDGYLYLTTGDQTAFKKSQDILNNLDGGVLRFDVDRDPSRSHAPIRTMPQDHGFNDEITGVGYWIPNDNPFQSPNGDRFEEYYSMGHRNPHRMTKDRATGDLYIGEIGGGRHEEINVVKKGGNFGWPLYEGLYRSTFCVPQLYNNMPHEEPLVAFPRSEANAVIGGFVYRGDEVPEIRGKYICADYGRGEEIWAVDINDGSYEQLGNFSSTNIISFGEDKQGELYILKQGTANLFKMVTKNSFEENLPQSLSDTGAFSDLATLTPSQGLIPYELIESFWSDGALKKRWIGVPNDGTHDTADEKIAYSENGNWDMPVGTVLVKHFEMPLDENDASVTKRLETRFSVKAANGEFYYVTYKWNDAQTDAVLLQSGLDENLNVAKADGSTEVVTWSYPDRSECVTCHNPATGGTIGPRTRYLNKDITYPTTGTTANQLVTLSHLGILDETITDNDTPGLLTYKRGDDLNATLDEKARSYLDLNCAYCHQSGSDVRADFDLRMQLGLAETNLLDAGIFNSLNIPNEAILEEGSPERSILYLRANSLADGVAMPPVAKNKIDTEGMAMLEAWIRQLGNVPNVAVYNVLASPASIDLNVGDTAQLTATVEPSNATDTAVTWFSNDTGIAEIDADTGTVTAIGPGSVTVTVTTNDGGYKASAVVNVAGDSQNPISVYNVMASPANVDILVGENVQLTAVTEPANATDQTVTWFSNDTDIATVDTNTGVVTGVGNGAIDVTAVTNDGGYRASVTVNVSGAQVAVYNVLTAQSRITLTQGNFFDLIATVEPADATNQGVSWFSNDITIAEVDANTGRVTGVAPGEVDVTVTTLDGGFRATTTVAVVPSGQSTITMFPVPADDFVNIDLSGYMDQEVQVQLFEVGNSLLTTETFPEDHPEINQLDVSAYPRGLYYITFSTPSRAESKLLFVE